MNPIDDWNAVNFPFHLEPNSHSATEVSNTHAELANLDDTFLSGSKLSGTIEINTALLREDLHLITFLKNQPVGAGLDVSSEADISEFDNTPLHSFAIGRVVAALRAVE
jgi:hypothetical protein